MDKEQEALGRYARSRIGGRFVDKCREKMARPRDGLSVCWMTTMGRGSGHPSSDYCDAEEAEKTGRTSGWMAVDEMP